jgi:hypothetical protein
MTYPATWWTQTGTGEKVAMAELEGKRFVTGDEISVYFVADSFDGFVYAVHGTVQYGESAILECYRYPAVLRERAPS